jgi:cobalt/nickel transport system permease protein
MSRGGFIEHTIEGLYSAMERALYAEAVAGGGGLLQSLDPRVKVVGLLGLVAAAALSARLWVIAALLLLAVLLAVLSRISVAMLVSRVWLGAFLFTGAIAIPALFLTPGDPAARVPVLGWIVTVQGLRTASYLLLRVEAAATLALLLVFTTPWAHVLKALRAVRAPVVFVVILGMTCRYVLLMLETAHEMFEARKSRTVGRLTLSERRHQAVSSAGVLLGKTLQLSNEVYLAMQARGFRGEVYVLDDFRMQSRDWAALTLFAALFAAAVWAGR